MPGRNEIFCGNRFPAITMIARARNSSTGSGLVISVSRTSACPTNSDSTAKIMKTFHSSGTPIGIDDRMPKWKQIMTVAAIAVGQPPWENSSTNGTSSSIAVLRMCDQLRRPAGAQILGEVAEEPALERTGPQHGTVGHHRRHHEREVPGELRGAG